MNENINLTKILKDCPEGTKLYSTIFGEVEFIKCDNFLYQIIVAKEGKYYCFTSEGTFIFERIKYNLGECVLFPSQDQRDWSKFYASLYKKEKFDPNELKPFDKVLTKFDGGCWSANLFSHIEERDYEHNILFVCNGSLVKFCIPYNDDTKHLVGTNEEAPEYYIYWK